MEITCTVCKSSFNTREKYERHEAGLSHKENMEIYKSGLSAGEHKSASRIAALEAHNAKLVAQLSVYIEKFDSQEISDNVLKKWLDIRWIPDTRALLAEVTK